MYWKDIHIPEVHKLLYTIYVHYMFTYHTVWHQCQLICNSSLAERANLFHMDDCDVTPPRRGEGGYAYIVCTECGEPLVFRCAFVYRCVYAYNRVYILVFIWNLNVHSCVSVYLCVRVSVCIMYGCISAFVWEKCRNHHKYIRFERLQPAPDKSFIETSERRFCETQGCAYMFYSPACIRAAGRSRSRKVCAEIPTSQSKITEHRAGKNVRGVDEFVEIRDRRMPVRNNTKM